MEAKTNFMQQYRDEYRATASPGLVQTRPAMYLSVTGQGDPSGTGFATHVQALYAAAYAVKFYSKAQGRDFVVPALEAQWWFDHDRYGMPHMADAPLLVPRSQWFYRLLLRMPGTLSAAEVENCKGQVRAKKQVAHLDAVALFPLNEGRCVQVLHTGPFDREPQTLALLAAYMHDKGLQHNGLHHEIYLSDFRKTSPGKLRTILREPVTVIS